MITRPFLWIAPLCCLAILCISYLELPWLFCIFLGILSSLLFTFVFKVKLVAVLALILLLLVTVRTHGALTQQKRFSQADGQTVRAEITVISSTERHSIVYARCRAKEVGLQGAPLQLYLNDHDLSVGERVLADVTLSSNTEQNEFAILSSDVVGSATVKKVRERKDSVGFLTVAHRLRTKLNRLLIGCLPPDESATLSALVLGDRSRLNSTLSTAARRSGITHIFVVSGLHLSIVVGSLIRFLKKFFGHPLFIFLITLVTVLLLCAVCGFSHSSLRAGLTFLLCSAAPLFCRENDSINTLGVAVVILLLLNPFSLFSLSFQLSVLSTLGILVLTPTFSKAFEKHPSAVLRAIMDSTILSLSAMFFTAPVLVACFGELSLIAPVTNLFISFAVTAALLLTVLGGLLSILPVANILSPVFFSAAGMMAKYLNEAAYFFSKFPLATVKLPKYVSGILWLFVLAILLCLDYRTAKKKKARYEKAVYGEEKCKE